MILIIGDDHAPLLEPLIVVVGAVVAGDTFSSLDGFFGDHLDAQGVSLALFDFAENFKFTVRLGFRSMVA